MYDPKICSLSKGHVSVYGKSACAGGGDGVAVGGDAISSLVFSVLSVVCNIPLSSIVAVVVGGSKPVLFTFPARF